MDGTALYECIAVLFVGQVLGEPLAFGDQVVVVILALLTSIGVAGVPSASLVAIVIILNNGGYRVLEAIAARSQPKRIDGVDIGHVDFVKIAEGQGVPSYHYLVRHLVFIDIGSIKEDKDVLEFRNDSDQLIVSRQKA